MKMSTIARIISVIRMAVSKNANCQIICECAVLICLWFFLIRYKPPLSMSLMYSEGKVVNVF